MAKVSATSSKGGISAAAVVNSARVAQSSTAMPPISVAARREEGMGAMELVDIFTPSGRSNRPRPLDEGGRGWG